MRIIIFLLLFCIYFSVSSTVFPKLNKLFTTICHGIFNVLKLILDLFSFFIVQVFANVIRRKKENVPVNNSSVTIVVN